MRQYFDVCVRARDVATAIRKDATFLDTVRRGFLPLPFDRQPAPAHVFGPMRGATPPPLAGRVGVVATGGSGALASLVGVAKALEDSGTEVSVYSVCSGSALFGFPLGAGMSPDEVAELTASMRPGGLHRRRVAGDRRAHRDVGAWLVRHPARREAGGVLSRSLRRSDAGAAADADVRADLECRAQPPGLVGARTHPDMPVAHAIRMAVALPLFVQPVVLDGMSWCDGGIVDIFPVRPVLDIEPAVDTAVAVNGFYPHEFGGEDITGWDDRPLSIVSAASQVRTCQQAALAREHLARLRRQARTLLVEPVPYGKVAGTGFYEQFLDTREWPEFMRAGREAMLASLRRHAPRAAA